MTKQVFDPQAAMGDGFAAVIGGGPAGLMAADELSRAGHKVLILEAKPSLARKFLMAGKSGLNLSKAEALDDMMPNFGTAADWLEPMIREFDSAAIVRWAEGLGQEVFVGSTGRIFPTVMKGSPLLRAWLARLETQGVRWRTGWRWSGWEEGQLAFETVHGVQLLRPTATVLALGGASWSRLGSDGQWAEVLRREGAELAGFEPANAALTVDWTPHMQTNFGAAIKHVRWSAGKLSSRGEATISGRGLEGGGLYALTPELRKGASLSVDLFPDLSETEIVSRLARPRGKTSWSNHLRKTLKLTGPKLALLQEFGHPLPKEPIALMPLIKCLNVRHSGLRPLDEAISTAGGLRRTSLDETLMLRCRPGVFCAGEMMDWEAPTGGYLLTACLATGRWAGKGATAYLDNAATR